MIIPKIIHQIWSGIEEPLPPLFEKLGNTWKEHHPDWEYILWDEKMMNAFIDENYPQYWDTYRSLPYNVQRWDSIRYLILNTMGGMYTDFDSECIDSHDELLKGETCCFSMEPKEHGLVLGKELYFNNALMACVPGHRFMKKVIENIFEKKLSYTGIRNLDILLTTGPLLLSDMYVSDDTKDDICLIPAKYVSPLTKQEIKALTEGNPTPEMEDKMQDARSIHYFLNTWSLKKN